MNPSPKYGRIIADTVELLREDLERQFALSGNPTKKGTFLQFIRRSLHPRFLPLILCRFSRLSFVLGIPGLSHVFSYLNLVLFGIQITPRCDIRGGFFLPHPSGIVVGAWRIDCNVTLFQQVTLGSKALDMDFTPDLLPEICANVTIGAGARVLGGIRLGEGVTVGANAVVLSSVEPNSTVAGIPARKVTPKLTAVRSRVK
jgi:serine O-acetyltransferase